MTNGQSGHDGATDSSSSDADVGTETAVSSTYKILGTLATEDGAGVLGTNTANSGTPIGVEGATPNASSGYGLSTPDDARVEGTAELEAIAGRVTDNTRVTSLRGAGLTVDGGALTLGPTNVQTETASTFAESDVSVSHDGTRVTDGDIELGQATTTVSRDSDDTSGDATGKSGLRCKAKVDSPAVTVTISENTSGESTVYLTNQDGRILLSEPSPGAGNSVELRGEGIFGGQEFWVVVDGGGDQYTCGVDSDASFPYRSSAIDLIAGIDEGTTVGTARAISSVTVAEDATAGSATVEWPRPASVRRWETATFDTDPDGQTVEVYVETSSDGGNTWSNWQSAPIGPGTDLSAIPAADRVRFRAELSRTDTGYNPRLTLLSRQYSP